MSKNYVSEVIELLKEAQETINWIDKKYKDQKDEDYFEDEITDKLEELQRSLASIHGKTASFSNNPKEYPKSCQKFFKYLDEYKEVSLSYNQLLDVKVKILHFYPTELAYPNGYHSAWSFQAVGFNIEKQERYDLGIHDSFNLAGSNENQKIRVIQYYIDGAFLIEFEDHVSVMAGTQRLFLNK